MNTPDNGTFVSTQTHASAGLSIQKWGGLACFVLVAALVPASLIYLMGDLRSALGPLAYALADFLYGPVWAASLITAVTALRERIGRHAPRRMSLALLAAALAAAAMVTVACMRSANRQYHLIHPELHLENSSDVLVVWTTMMTGLNGVAAHFLGWASVLAGSAGWTSRRLPRRLSALYVVAGAVLLLVYALPGLGEWACPLGAAASVWLGIVLWKGEPQEAHATESSASPPDPA